MTLTLREKLTGYQLFQPFVSPYTDRTLKPFIFRDNAMTPPWLSFLDEIVNFDPTTLKLTPCREIVKHDHNYARETELPCGKKSEREDDLSVSEKEKLEEEMLGNEGEQEGNSSDDKDNMGIEKNMKDNGSEDERARKGNVVKNKEDTIRTKDKLSPGRTIDFCYVREEHIRAINTLVEEQFWPNINLSECLHYPEFTVVALYKKLVVGLGAMVPNHGKPNETYITFLATRRHWGRAGIGSFMLYHLIATCQSSHITLHCSVSRGEALNLYFKFGFKVQCVVLNFYKPYLSSHPDVDMSPHAYHLKYTRNIN